MMTHGIAPRPEQEIMFELKLLDELKNRLASDSKTSIEEPHTIDEMKIALKHQELSHSE